MTHLVNDPKKFKEMVEAAIEDELGAVAMYSTMAKMASNPTLRALLHGIAGDEYGHARTWMVLKECLGEYEYKD